MKTQKIVSKKIYEIQTSVNGIVENFRITLNEIIYEDEDEDDDSETIYSMREVIDDILDLKINKCFWFQPNRDDDESKGIITRIK